MKPIYQLKIVATATLTLALAACGGGGGSTSAPAPAPVASVATAQGIWQSAPGAAASVSAVVLPDGQLWSIVADAGSVRMTKASLAVQGAGFAGSGTSYTLGGAAASATVSASAVEKTSLNGSIVSAGHSDALALAYQSRYETAAKLADVAGLWQATLGPGVVSWSIDAAGVLSGTRTTGCTYTGQLSLRAEQKAVLEAAVTEHCAGAPALALAGVALLSADKANLVMLMTSADGATGVAVNLAH
jgi:hypothetical protein